MKKWLAAILSCFMLVNMTAYAFEFPEPDWGAILAERKAMVTETEFELYTEGSIESAPYYGARLEPRGGTYIGMVADTATNFLPLGSYLTYIDGMWQEDLYYPSNTMIQNDDVVPMIGWTISDLSSVDYTQVRRMLDQLNTYNKPMFIRFANEMNCSALGDDPTRYVDIFRNVANMVHEYPNFAVVWSPNDLGSLDRPFEYYYPGDEYVDWIGLSSYAIRYFMGQKDTAYNDTVFFMTGDYAWATNRVKPLIDFMEKNNIQKPIMISEGGVATNNIYGDDYTAWSAPRLRNMLWYLCMQYPQIKMINYFNTHRAGETERFDISGYSYAEEIYKEAAASGAYIRQASQPAEFVFQPANAGETLTAKDGIVKLYTLAYFASQPDIAVSYSIDGNWYTTANQIPYTCNLSVANITDGYHTMTIRIGDTTKDYGFYKSGQSIRFGAEPVADVVTTPVQDTISVLVNGVAISFDQPPVIQDGRTLVPLRAIFEALGAEVAWDGTTNTVAAARSGIGISLQIGANEMYKNGTAIAVDVPAQIMNGRTMVPVRVIAEAFGAEVQWDAQSRTVLINE